VNCVIENFADKVERAINYLPPIPIVMDELLKALNDEDVDINALVRIISKDPSMSMNVLKVVNSAFYRLPYQVSAVDHALRLLGLKEVTMICIACGAYKALAPSHNTQTFNLDEFWKHSVATGIIAKRLCKELKIGDQDTVYFLGLLHDVGKVILDRVAHDIYTIVIQTTYDESIPIQEAEKRLIGESHDTMGGLIMKKWRLPPTFSHAARYHHAVPAAPEENRAIVAIVSLADQMARVRFLGFGGDMSGIVFSETDAFRELEMTSPVIKEMDVVKFIWDLEEVDEEVIEMERLLSS
jgi:putative nucleotidyltransferase with HDIG domain